MVKRLFLISLSLSMIRGFAASEPGADAPFISSVRELKAAGLEHVFALTTNLMSGGSPRGSEGFAALAKLGIKTIITVDGAQPDLARAKAHGMRYIHLPHGYDGISRDMQLQLIRATQTAQGPIYIHCHHGQHRGPAAAAVICLSQNNWTVSQANAWLKNAGTGTNYHGLFATVRNFRKPTEGEMESVPTNFPEARKVSGLVESMVSIDETFERLKSLRAASQTPCPDNHLISEATLLREDLREAHRLGDAKNRGRKFLKLLTEAEQIAKTFEDSLSSSTDNAAIDRAFHLVEQSCISCHREYRDRMPSPAKSVLRLGR